MADAPESGVGETEQAVFERLDALAPRGAVGVAVSGGGDSVALAVIADRWARRYGIALSLATVDHGLRPQAATEAAGVADLAAHLGWPHDILDCGADLEGQSGNLPAAARDARYAALADWATRQGLAAVLLGHTRDDQAETVLMRLARGSGVEGLSAMAEDNLRLNIRWLRPLLGVGRADLRRYLRAQGVAWVEDPTNEDLSHDRVKARRALAHLAPLGITAEGLAETADRLRRQRQVLERDLRRLASRSASVRDGCILIDRAAWHSGEEDTRLRLLAWALTTLSGAHYKPRFRSLEHVAAMIGDRDEGCATLSGCLIRWQRKPRELISVFREPSASAGPVALGPGRTVFDARWALDCPDALPKGLSVGAISAREQEQITAGLRRDGNDLAEDWLSLPRDLRTSLPAIRDASGQIVGIGRATDTPFTVISPDLGITFDDLVNSDLNRLILGQ